MSWVRGSGRCCAGCRPDPDVPAVLELGELTVRVAEGRVLRGGEEVPLTKTEFRLLCALALAGARW